MTGGVAFYLPAQHDQVHRLGDSPREVEVFLTSAGAVQDRVAAVGLTMLNHPWPRRCKTIHILLSVEDFRAS
jgi:hypothetical protein